MALGEIECPRRHGQFSPYWPFHLSSRLSGGTVEGARTAYTAGHYHVGRSPVHSADCPTIYAYFVPRPSSCPTATCNLGLRQDVPWAGHECPPGGHFRKAG